MAAGPQNDEPPRPKICDLYTSDTFNEALQATLRKGDTWYLIDYKWFQQCRKYLGFEASKEGEQGANNDHYHPGPIDNSDLWDIKDPSEIRKHMIEEMDYSFLPKVIWDQLLEDFGMVEGQSSIPRIAREYGMFVKHIRVEIYPMSIKLGRFTDDGETSDLVSRKFSRADKIETVLKEVRKVFNIEDTVEARLWSKYSRNTFEPLFDLEQTIQDSGIYVDQAIMAEMKGEDGTWPRETLQKSNCSNEEPASKDTNTPLPPLLTIEDLKKESSPAPPSTSTAVALPTGGSSNGSNSTTSNQKYSSYMMDSRQAEEGVEPGLCGLTNLGNTCFMNSIIQGLSNTPHIAEYFENDNFEEDINTDNPLGMKGEIAKSFGQLIKDMWSGRYKYIMPRNFKSVVGRFAPQFSGYSQQDSQELLTFLLDGLHEDLNRIKVKPYVEMPDSDGREDADIAREAWENYKLRNDSVILDIFHGLLKSTLVCPTCNKLSVKFDPMCYLSLPLPVKKERKIELFYVSMCPRVAVQYKVTCPKEGTIGDMLEALSKHVGIPANQLVATDVYNHRFHKVYQASESVSSILEKDDIFVYEVSDPEDKSQVVVPVYLRSRKLSSGFSPSSLFGQPFLLSAPTEITEEDLFDLLLDRMSRYVSRPNTGEEWWKAPKPAKQPPQDNAVEKMEINGDNSGENGDILPVGNSNISAAASSTNCETTVTCNGSMVSTSVNGGSEAQSPASEESPSSEASPNMPNIQDEDMNSDEENDAPPPDKIFTVTFTNSYGSNSISDGCVTSASGHIRLDPKLYLGLDWHPRAKELFYNEKSAEDVSQDESFHATEAPKKQTVNLAECLQLYTSQEKLGMDDAWRCPRCKELRQATKKFDLWMLPEVLIISLKRFSYNRFLRDKIDVLVDFPLKGLDMTPYVIAPTHGKSIYDLIAVSNHYGGMGGGHYTAYGKNRKDSKWYYFDDNNVTEATGKVVTSAAYVLFYQRRSESAQSESAAKPATVTSGLLHKQDEARLVNGARSPTVNNAGHQTHANENGVNNTISSDEDMEF